mgnify:FL=1
MKEGYRLLGDFIRQVDVRNTDGKEENLLGVSVQKMFIPSIANTVGTDFTKYKVVKRGQFTYIPDTSRRGDKIGIALLTDYDEGLVSNIYTVFEVKDENELLPEYLMLWFSRPEFDRYARFKSHGSVREIMDWDEMCKVELPVPSIDKQRSIVKAYQTITERIELKRRINDNLEAQTQALFDELFLRDGMPDCTLSEIANVNPTRTLSKGCIAKCYDMSCLPTRGCVPEGGEIKAYNGGVRFQNGDTLIARITPCLENGKAAYINILNDKEVAFGSTEYIVFSPVDTMPSSFYYFLIRGKKFRAFALQYMNGSSGRQRVSGDELAAFPLTKPSHEALSRFDMVAKPVLEQFKVASLEINRLNALQQLIIASISSR